MHFPPCRPLPAMLLGLLLSSACRGEDYPIKLSRAATVGDKYALAIVGAATERLIVTREGQKPDVQDREYRVEVEGLFEPLEVDSRGQETKVSARLDKCVWVAGGARRELLPRGAVVVGEHRDGKSVFTLDKGELSPQAQEALDLVFPVHEAEASFDDDAVFGTPGRKKVGDSWPVNAEAAGADLKNKGLLIRPEDVSGRTELVSAGDAQGEPCLTVQSTFIAGKIAGALPGGLTIRRGDLQMALSAVLPIDPDKPRVKSTLVMKTTIAAEGVEDEKKVAVEIRSERSCAYQRPAGKR